MKHISENLLKRIKLINGSKKKLDFLELQPLQCAIGGCMLTCSWLDALLTSSTRLLKSQDKKH